MDDDEGYPYDETETSICEIYGILSVNLIGILMNFDEFWWILPPVSHHVLRFFSGEHHLKFPGDFPWFPCQIALRTSPRCHDPKSIGRMFSQSNWYRLGFDTFWYPIFRSNQIHPNTMIHCLNPDFTWSKSNYPISPCLSIFHIYLSIYLSICLSIYLSIYLSIFLYISLSLYIYIYLCVCVCLCPKQKLKHHFYRK